MQALRAFAYVVFLRFTRSGLSRTPKLVSVGRAIANLIAPLLFASVYGILGTTLGSVARSSPEARGWLMLGVFLFIAGFAALAEVPPSGAGRAQASLAAHPLLHSLPIPFFLRPLLALFVQVFQLPVPLCALLASADPSPRAWLTAIVLAFSLILAAVFAGTCATSWLRVWLPPHWVPRASVVLMLLGNVGGLYVMIFSLGLAKILSPSPLLLYPALALSQSPPLVTSLLGLLPFPIALIAAAALLRAAERRGHDQIAGAPADRPKPTSTADRSVPAVEQLMSSRDFARPGVTLGLQLGVFALSAAGALVSWPHLRHHVGHDTEFRAALQGILIFGAYTLFLLLASRAQRMVLRDVGARPLLATLPLEPRALLRGKAAALRRLVLPFAAVLLPWLVALPWRLAPELLWRLIVGTAAIALACEGCVSVAFLRAGVGTAGGSRRFDLGNLVLMFPLFAVVGAASPVAALLALGLLAAVAWEANRASQQAVRWIDDLDEALTRNTEVWRALLVLALFFALQGLGLRAVRSLLEPKHLSTGTLFVLIAAQLQLAAQTLGRKGLDPQLPDRARGWGLSALGLFAGALSGTAALGYVALLRRLHVDLPESALSLSPGSGRILLFLAVAVGAPVAEELFFRGWLQPALQRELSSRWRNYAFVLTALAFAAIHGPIPFVPVLLLGLLAGALRLWTGNIVASILAHAVHNAIAIGFGAGP